MKQQAILISERKVFQAEVLIWVYSWSVKSTVRGTSMLPEAREAREARVVGGEVREGMGGQII